MHRDCLCQRRLAIPWGAAVEKLGDAVFARFCSSSFQSDVDMRVVRCLVFHTMAGLWQSSFSPHSDAEAAGPRIDVLAYCQPRGPRSGVPRERALPVYIIFKNNKVRTDARLKPSTLEGALPDKRSMDILSAVLGPPGPCLTQQRRVRILTAHTIEGAQAEPHSTTDAHGIEAALEAAEIPGEVPWRQEHRTSTGG